MRPRVAESHQGMWCLVDNPDQLIPGVLQIDSAGRQRLELIGELPEIADSDSRNADRRIFGVIAANNGVTLRGCFLVRTEGFFSPSVKQVWHSNEAIFGIKFTGDEPWVFSGVEYEIPALTNWVQRSQHGFFYENDALGRVCKVGFTKTLERWPLWKYKDGVVELRNGVQVKHPFEGVTELESKIVARGAFRSLHDPKDFHHGIARPLQVLLALATSEYTSPISAKVSIDSPANTDPPEYVRWHREPLEFTISPMQLEYAFRYSDFAKLESTQAWIDSQLRLHAVWRLYLAALKRETPIETRFLFVVQSLEAFHRSVLEKSARPETTRKPLRGRLEELLDSLGSNANSICGRDKEAFVCLVKDSRNYYTHWSIKGASQPIDGEQLVYLTWRLLTMLELLIASAIGFDAASEPWRRIENRRIRRIPE